jgi:hypothetical protein
VDGRSLCADIDDGITVGEETADRKCIVIDRDRSQSGNARRSDARVNALGTRHTYSKGPGSAIESVQAHDRIRFFQVPTGEALCFEPRCAQSFGPTHLGKPNGSEHASRRADCEHAATFAGSDLGQHVFDHGGNELGLLNAQRRHGVVGDVASDDRSDPYAPFTTGLRACDSRARRPYIDPERE